MGVVCFSFHPSASYVACKLLALLSLKELLCAYICFSGNWKPGHAPWKFWIVLTLLDLNLYNLNGLNYFDWLWVSNDYLVLIRNHLEYLILYLSKSLAWVSWGIKIVFCRILRSYVSQRDWSSICHFWFSWWCFCCDCFKIFSLRECWY